MTITRTKENSQVEAQWAFTSFARRSVKMAALGRPYKRNPQEWREGMIIQVERALHKAKPNCPSIKCEIKTIAPELERVCVKIRGYDAYFKTFDFEK